MDDNQCRACLGEAHDSRLSVFKQVDGVTIQEKLNFITGIKITKDDNFSKLLCLKCFNETIRTENFKRKCLDTERTLQNLERKFQSKLKEKVQQIFQQAGSLKNEQYVEYDAETEEATFIRDDENSQHESNDEQVDEGKQIYFYEEIKIEENQEASQPHADIYEEVEYLETDLVEESTFSVTVQNEIPIKKLEKFHCEICPQYKAFRTEIGINLHKWEAHQTGDVNPLECQSCNFVFDAKIKEETLTKSMLKHQTAHDSGKMNSCTFCPEVFKSRHHLEEHRSRHHTSPPKSHNKCKSCLTNCDTYQDLQEHLSTTDCQENHERPFKCYICNETFIMGIAKKKHIQTEHQDKVGADCPLCVRCRIPSAVAYENHYKTHFADPRFCCSYCGKPFYESDRLQTHIKRAHQNTKLLCNWCNRSFRDKSGIARHILGVHFNQRNHQCTICSKAFTASYNLKEHMFGVHKQATKFYTCEYCSQDFLYRKKFERHRNLCSGIPEKGRR